MLKARNTRIIEMRYIDDLEKIGGLKKSFQKPRFKLLLQKNITLKDYVNFCITV